MRLLEAEPRKLLPYFAGMSGAAHGPVIRVAPPALHSVRHGHGRVDPTWRVDTGSPGPGVPRVFPSFFEADHSNLPMTMWGQTRVILPPRQLPWGLREGWVQCDWCWAWCYFIYTRDEVPELCGRCLQLYRDGGEPPWWPNERQRWRLRVQRLFRRQLRHAPPIPVEVCKKIAAFVARPWMP